MSNEIDKKFIRMRQEHPDWYKDWLIVQPHLIEKEIEKEEQAKQRPLTRPEQFNLAVQWNNTQADTIKEEYFNFREKSQH